MISTQTVGFLARPTVFWGKDMPNITALDHIVLTVSDLDRAIDFYRAVLGMTHHEFTGTDGTQRHAVSFGAQKINLHLAGQEFAPHALAPSVGAGDFCFLSSDSIDVWRTHLATHDIIIEQGPIQRTGAIGPIMSIYIRDPDGTLIEIANQV